MLVAGIGYSYFLTWLHRSASAGAAAGWSCGESGWSDCSATLGSKYSVVMGLPVTVYATAWFAALLALHLSSSWSPRHQAVASRMLFVGTLAAFGVTAFYAGISIFVLRTLCLYCSGLYLVVALSVWLAFVGLKSSATLPAAPPLHALGLSVAGLAPWLRGAGRPSAVFVVGVALLRSTSPAAPVVSSPPVPALAGTTRDPLAAVPHRGSQQAMLRITKFTDFRCSACRFSARELHAFMAKHPGAAVDLRCVNIPARFMKEGQDLSDPACLPARMGIVMQRRGLFWAYYEGIYFSDQPVDDALVWHVVARLIGKDGETEIRREAESAATVAALAANIALARSHEVRRTPTMIVNGRMEVGALERTEWEAQLAQARAAGPAGAITRSSADAGPP